MNGILLTLLTAAAAYLLGAIPFGYVIFYAARGIDIRTVGSGNIGATNVGRQLGFRYFLLVFLLDMAKGFLPTWGLPQLAARLSGRELPDLRVVVALATIMGHNFPVYLKFRGGKGVATSFGALLALDWVASVASLAGFLIAFTLTRYVSAASLVGGLSFLLAYGLAVKDPWGPRQRAMTALTFGLVAMLFFRHRKNLVRIAQGTEPKVSFRKKPPPATAEPTA